MGRSTPLQNGPSLQIWSFLPRALIPGVWLLFSYHYSRPPNQQRSISQLSTVALAFLVPLLLIYLAQDSLVISKAFQWPASDFEIGWSGFVLFLALLICSALLLINLEKTFRAATGTHRWQIKYVVLGVATIFTARIYTSSQIVLSHHSNASFDTINTAALFLACIFFVTAFSRKAIFRVEVYPSEKVLHVSITTILIGCYLFFLGIFSKVLSYWEGPNSLAVRTFLIIVSLAAVAIFLLSERSRDLLKRFVSRHFNRPIYDYRAIWLGLTEKTASVVSPDALCRIIVNWLSENLRVLSTSVWLLDSETGAFRLAASTGLPADSGFFFDANSASTAKLISTLKEKNSPFDIDTLDEQTGALLKACFPDHFQKAGNRVCVPLAAGENMLGFITLGDRVNYIPLTHQEYDLLKCVADHIASILLNFQLSRSLVQAKEMEAFQTIAAFFIHDLKNTASTLNLTLQNLPKHFDNPEFRKDALKAISKSVSHIQELISRLTLFRQKIELNPKELNLNDLLQSTIPCLAGQVPVQTEFGLIESIRADQEQLQKVFTNLLLNAREALKESGQINISTSQQNGWVVTSVSDNGCGMSPEFVAHSLFRPFKTTKKGGIGIGMFQTKTIVEAHQGRIDVESQPGRGTTFKVFLPKK